MDLTRDSDLLYAALIRRDPAYDGFVYVGVRSTGVFCRLTCPARKPKRANVVFFDHADAAQSAGFRACLRCKPLERGVLDSAVTTLVRRVRAEPDARWSAAKLGALGFDPSTVRRTFKREYGVTFAQFARSQRLGNGVSILRAGAPVVQAQLDAGYESASGFREAINRLLGTAPARTQHRRLLTAQWLETPIGAMLGVADDDGVHLLEFADRTALPGELTRLGRAGAICFGNHVLLDRLGDELDAFFADAASPFTVALAQRGSGFQCSVWEALRQIPSGETRSYAALARAIGRPEAVRAVARANGANQLAILVPCHRVIGADGALVGYGGKLWRKQWLLTHERRRASRVDTPAIDA